MRERAARHRTEHEAAVAEARQRWAPELERAAADLRTTGTAHLALGDRSIDARIVRFWRGDDVLHVVASGPGERSESRSRISRRHRDSDDVLLAYLVRAAARP
jgi:hypothetical protein